jgi:hypothetical protein
VKRVGRLFDRIVSFENLHAAFVAARRGKRRTEEMAAFELGLESRLSDLGDRLLAGRYRFGPYRSFRIFDPKPRTIVAAPFADRVVHHAICRIVEPVFDRTFVADSFACRVGKGNLAAVLRLHHFVREVPAGFGLSCDVRKYFQSVRHDVLLRLLARKLKDDRLLDLLSGLIDSSPVDPAFGPGRGIPIGNLTSQLFANVYLSPLDHHAKQDLGLRRYVRYVDDIVVVEPDRARLVDARAALTEALDRLGLAFHPHRCSIAALARGVPFLGYLVFPGRLRVRSDGVRRFARRERWLRRRWAVGEIDAAGYWMSVESWTAFAGHSDGGGLLARLDLRRES